MPTYLQVSYKTERSTLLSLEIPVEAAVNKAEVDDYNEREQKRQKLKPEESSEDVVFPKVPFDACLQKFASDEIIEDYFSAFLNANSQAKKTSRISSFPPYLMVHLRRYYVGEDWTPKKLDALVNMPDIINLSALRGRGPQVSFYLRTEYQVMIILELLFFCSLVKNFNPMALLNLSNCQIPTLLLSSLLWDSQKIAASVQL